MILHNDILASSAVKGTKFSQKEIDNLLKNELVVEKFAESSMPRWYSWHKEKGEGKKWVQTEKATIF